MKNITCFLIALLFVGTGWASAQTRTVTGTVVAQADGQPVIGATVMVVGTTIGSVTDIDGQFRIQNVPSTATQITVSYVGMISETLPIRNNMTISMRENAELLEEVIVTAYGTAKKESFTGSASVIKADKLQERPIANLTKALDGLVAGVQSTSGSGQPGASATIVIRGYGSINASRNPLYVVDGIPYDGSISALNPNDIESMTILKDASAGALYGARGANGVVMVTTKQGTSGKTSVSLKANWGVASRAIPRYETMDEAGYLETIYQSYRNNEILNNGLSPAAAGPAALQAMKSGATAMLGANEQYNPFNYSITELIDPTTGKVRSDAKLRYHEDWLDTAMRDNPLRQEYNVEIAGGREKSTWMFSLGYLDEEGLLEMTQFKRYSGRMNIDSEITDWFKGRISANYARNQSNSREENNSLSSNVWYSAQLMAPIFPVYEKDASGQTVYDALGKPVFDYGANRPAGASSNWNTIATLYDDRYASNSDNLSGRVAFTLGDLKSGLLQGLKFDVSYGFDLINSQSMEYYNPYNGNSVAVKGSLDKWNYRYYSATFNQLLNYDRRFGLHHVEALVGHEYYSYQRDYLDAAKTGFPFGGLYELAAATTITDATSQQDNYRIDSYLSRLNYDFADRYYLSLSYRRDGSSRFKKEARWGNFWSVGGNWRISEEAFMDNYEWVNNLSLKASYGVQGNDNILNGSGSVNYYGWQSFYDLGYPNANQSGALLSSLENPDLRWEKNANLNIGVEARLFDRVRATVEWYNRKTTDMLLDYPMASSLGFDGYNKNVGSMRNVGLDLGVDVDVFNGDFQWTASLLGSFVRNKVLQLADKPEIISGSYITKEGETLDSYYTATSAGVDPATGQALYLVWDSTDESGNPVDPYVSNSSTKANASKRIQGSRIPDFYGSVNNRLAYKGFDLNVLVTYSLGGKVLDSVNRTFIYGNYVGQAKSAALERAWKQPGDITDIPRIEIGKSYIVTDADLIDASYLALKSITLGYSLPSDWVRHIGMQSVRLTAAGDNLLMFTHLKGMNPQYNFSGGTNFGFVPTRTVTLGVDIKF